MRNKEAHTNFLPIPSTKLGPHLWVIDISSPHCDEACAAPHVIEVQYQALEPTHSHAHRTTTRRKTVTPLGFHKFRLGGVFLFRRTFLRRTADHAQSQAPGPKDAALGKTARRISSKRDSGFRKRRSQFAGAVLSTERPLSGLWCTRRGEETRSFQKIGKSILDFKMYRPPYYCCIATPACRSPQGAPSILLRQVIRSKHWCLGNV